MSSIFTFDTFGGEWYNYDEDIEFEYNGSTQINRVPYPHYSRKSFGARGICSHWKQKGVQYA